MGRIKYFVYSVSKIFPYKHRKPFIIISGILGMLIFMDFMIQVSGSVYLISLKTEINELMSMPVFILFVCISLGYVGMKYYKSLKMSISIGYLIILILAILPMLLGA